MFYYKERRLGVHIAYVTLYTCDWAPIGQVTIDLGKLYRFGRIEHGG
jgi:hypothetical protein